VENVFEQLEHCFFFQAEDGIRDFHVTGVQTCALPIWFSYKGKYVCYKELKNEFPNITFNKVKKILDSSKDYAIYKLIPKKYMFRSEERRVGKENKSRW